jgi:hypothetical protein
VVELLVEVLRALRALAVEADTEADVDDEHHRLDQLVDDMVADVDVER